MESPGFLNLWRHHSGRYYVSVLIANNTDKANEKYPVAVVYIGASNFKVWTGRLDDWHRRMTRISWWSMFRKDRVI